MRKTFLYLVGGVVVLFAVVLLALNSYTPLDASPPYAIPTTIPDLAGPPSDSVSRSYGGRFLNGIAIQGGADEQQFVIVANSTQTALTPVAEVQSYDGSSVFSVQAGGSGVSSGGVVINAPTAQATGVPALVVDNKGSVANTFGVRVNATPQFTIGPSGAANFAGAMTISSGNVQVAQSGVELIVTVPTAQATATPGMRINNTSAGAVSLQVEVNTTPVAQFLRGGGQTINTGNLTLTSGNATLTSGNLVLTAGKIINTIPAAVAVTDGSTITCGGSVCLLSAAGDYGTSSIAAGVSGQILFLLGPASNSVTLTDTGTLKLGGNRALGANDSLLLVNDGTNWNEVAYVNN